MTYATVMVNVAADQPDEAVLAVACDLAGRSHARLIGISAAEFSPPLYFTSGQFAERLVEEGRAKIAARLTEAEAQFRKAVQGGGVTGEWRAAQAMPADYVAAQARAADILVTAAGPDRVTDPFAGADVHDLVMKVGRPLLIVAPEARWLDLRHVLIAWKETREARKAVADALPLLKVARYITIAHVLEGGEDRDDALAAVEDVRAWLALHGITATVLVPERAADAAGGLDSIALDSGAGLIVAGAYGHSRFREWVLGGVTRVLATGAVRCAFLSR